MVLPDAASRQLRHGSPGINPILADVEIDGAMRKVVYVLGKPGILWALDRESGEYLWHRQLVTFQNLYEHLDPTTGEISMNEELIPTEMETLRWYARECAVASCSKQMPTTP